MPITIPSRSEIILSALVADKDNWVWEGRPKMAVKLKTDKVMGIYWNRIQGEWVEEIHFGQLYRVYNLLYALKSGHPAYIDQDFISTHFSAAIVDGKEVTYLDCDDCMLEVQHRLHNQFNRWWFERYPDWRILSYKEVEQWLIENAMPPTGAQPRLF